jgi:hypothetical protein
VKIPVFNISGMMSALFVGWWCDRSEKVRNILLIVNLPQLLGQFIYFAGFSAESLILARFISGKIGTKLYFEEHCSSTIIHFLDFDRCWFTDTFH